MALSWLNKEVNIGQYSKVCFKMLVEKDPMLSGFVTTMSGSHKRNDFKERGPQHQINPAACIV